MDMSSSPGCPTSFWLPVNAPGKAAEGGLFARLTTTLVGDPQEALGCWLFLVQTQLFSAIWGVSQRMEDVFLLSLCFFVFQSSILIVVF